MGDRQETETERQPAHEIHIGEITGDEGSRQRHVIVWLNGRRWEGDLTLQKAGT